MNKNIEISIIFPAYNEEASIVSAVSKAVKFAQKKFSNFEIIVVNDGSKDKTGQLVLDFAKDNKSVRVINHSTNQGYGAAVWDGLKAAHGKYIFFTDSDLQFDIGELERFITYIKENDVVIGYRAKRHDPWMRKLNAWGWKWIVRILLGLKIKDVDCAFKLFKREVIEKIDVESHGATFSAELLYKIKKAHFEVKELPVKHMPRKAGSPTGAKLSVIRKAFIEIWCLYLKDPVLVKSRSIVVYLTAVLALFSSRIFLVSNSADFFDSNQYVWRATLPRFIEVLTTGHPPFHPLYNLFSSIFYKLHLVSDGIAAATLPSVVFGTLSIVVIFLLTKELFKNKIAWITALIYTFIPYVWISQITILVDATEHFFYFLSLYLIVLSLKSKKGYLLALFAGLMFGLALFSHTQAAIWAPAFLSMMVLFPKSLSRSEIGKTFTKIILFFIGAFALLLINAELLVIASATRSDLPYAATYLSALKYLILGNTGDRESLTIIGTSRLLCIVSTTLLYITSILGGIKLLINRKYKEFVALFIFIVPSSVLASSFIYENLYGRTLIIAMFPISTLAAYFISSIRPKWGNILGILILLQLIVVSVPAVWRYHATPPAFDELKTLEEGSLPGGIFVASNITKTFSNYKGEFVNFGDVGVGGGSVQEKTKNALDSGKPVFISHDAIIHPFRHYDGAFFDPRTTGSALGGYNGTLLSDMFTKYNFTLDKVASSYYDVSSYNVTSSPSDDFVHNIEANLDTGEIVFGRLLDQKKPVMSASIKMYNTSFCKTPIDDLTKNDLGFCLKRAISTDSRPETWSYTDKDGWFYLQKRTPMKYLAVSTSASQTRIPELKGQFILSKDSMINGRKVAEYDNSEDLRQATLLMDGSFYVVASKKYNSVNYQVFSFEYSADKTNRIFAKDLSGEAGQLRKNKQSSGGFVRSSAPGDKEGFLIGGPYLPLEEGKYRVKFALRSNHVSDKMVELNVASKNASLISAQKYIEDSEIMGDMFVLESLEFDVAQPQNDFEFRVRVPSNSIVELDYIELDKI